ncbi:MAG: hypothetical protein M1314_00695 [Firmicutes bacterium]|nr:hypothetical protein [Bacillota bacterium]
MLQPHAVVRRIPKGPLKLLCDREDGVGKVGVGRKREMQVREVFADVSTLKFDARVGK